MKNKKLKLFFGNENFAVKSNMEPVTGTFAIQTYKPQDIIAQISLVVAVPNKKTSFQPKHDTEYDQEFSKFLAHAPDNFVLTKHPQLRVAIICLQANIEVDQLVGFQSIPSEVPLSQIKEVARRYGKPIEYIKKLIELTHSNTVQINGLFSDPIGVGLVNLSQYNSSPTGNAFTWVTHNSVFIIAKTDIPEGTEIQLNTQKPPKLICTDLAKMNNHDAKLAYLYEFRFSDNQDMQTQIGQLIFENHFKLWAAKRNAIDQRLLDFVLKDGLEISPTWILGQLIAIAMLHQANSGYDSILDKLVFYLRTKNMFTHLLIAISINPHVYHQSLLESLSK